MSRENPSGIKNLSRRETLPRLGSGFGGLALGTLLDDFDRSASGTEATSHNLPPKAAHHAPKAQAVIQLFIPGADETGTK